MPAFGLSGEALVMLRSNGWHEGGQADIGGVTAFLRSKGIQVSPIAADFLREFHGLHLRLGNGGVSAMNFNVYEQLNFMEEGELDHLQTLIGQTLCPVGVGGRFLLFISPSGEMIFLHDEWLLYLRARNVHDGFEVIRTLEFRGHQTITLADDQKPPAFRDAQ
jgi:hypothetical protein